MPGPTDTPPPERLRALDAVCDDFESSWQKGARPLIEQQLDKVDEDVRPFLLEELIRTELECRCRLGEQPSGAEYHSRFPAHDSQLAAWLAEARRSAELLCGAASGETGSYGFLSPATEAGGGTPVAVTPPRTLGEYDLLERLGAGGMGEVYKARHRRLDKLVAVKLLGERLAGSGVGVARFLREMKAAGALEHPNVVEAIDAGEQDGVVYLVMKLIAGTDLARLVRERGPLPIDEACEAARQAALGLHYLHERGLIHRDIKASNLMRTPDGTVKILDLGLARWRDGGAAGDDLTCAGAVMGTPDFLAPEQIGVTETVGVAADLYSLGGTLFHLLTAQAPFAHRGGLDAKLKAHRSEEAPDVRALRPQTPAALADLVRRLLAKDPRDRPASAAAVSDELAAFTPVAGAQGSTATYHSGIVSRRKRWWPWVAAGAAALVVAASVAVAIYHHRPKEVAQEVAPDLPVQAEPPRVERLEIKHFTTLPGNDQPRGILGVDSFAAVLDDSVTVAARLSRPAYAYLIAYRPDGTEELCFPESEDELPPKTERPRYPSVSRGVNYGLNEGTGLQVFAVLASSEPLPAYKVWRARRGASPWKPAPAPVGVVWWDDGQVVEALTIDNPLGRGKGKKVAGKTPLVEVLDWLRAAPEAETAAGMAFAVLPKRQR